MWVESLALEARAPYDCDTVTIKLFDYAPATLAPAPKDGMFMGSTPSEQEKPFADSDAGFEVIELSRSARRPNDWSSRDSDPKPFPVKQAEGTMQLTPVGFESKWDADGAHLPFTLTKK